MKHLVRPFIAVLLVVACAAGLAACGSSNGDASASTLIKDTFGSGHPIRSGRVDVQLDVALQGFARLPKPLSLHLSGPFQSNGGKTLPDFALELDVDSGTRPVTIGATFAQGGGFLTLEGQAFDLGPQTYQAFQQGYLRAKADQKSQSAAPSLKALGVDPQRWLRDPRKAGSEDIAGTQTDHVTAGVDVGQFLNDLSTLLGRARGVAGASGAAVPSQLTPQQRQEIQRSIKSATIDVWTGTKDHTLRRVALDIVLAVPPDLQTSVGGLRGGHIGLNATIAQLNQHQVITKPKGARPVGELRAALQQLGLVGASSGSSGGASTTTPPASAAPSSAPSAYATCLQQAGDDLAKVQRCADLLQ